MAEPSGDWDPVLFQSLAQSAGRRPEHEEAAERVRQFTRAAREVAHHLSRLGDDRDRGDVSAGKKIEEVRTLQAGVDGSPGKLAQLGNEALNSAERSLPEALPAVAKLHLAVGAMLTTSGDPEDVDTACSELKEALDRALANAARQRQAGGPNEGAPEPQPKPTPTRSTKTRKEQQAEWLANAMLLVRDHPDWSDAAIAAKVGKNPSTLSRNPDFKAAAKMARGSKNGRRKGHISIDPESGQREIEAYSDDPAERDWDE